MAVGNYCPVMINQRLSTSVLSHLQHLCLSTLPVLSLSPQPLWCGTSTSDKEWVLVAYKKCMEVREKYCYCVDLRVDQKSEVLLETCVMATSDRVCCLYMEFERV